MNARVVKVQLQPGKMDEFLHLFEGEFVTALKQDQGFDQVLVLADRGTESVLALAVYGSVADAEASEAGFRDRAKMAAHLFTGPPSASIYEVAIRA